MILKQTIFIDKYDWDLIIFYNTKHKQIILDTIKKAGCSIKKLDNIEKFLNSDEINTGFIYTNKEDRISVIVIGRASSIGEYINTLEHEKNHLEMHICSSLNIDPMSEKAAVLSGYLAQLILDNALEEIIYKQDINI